MIALYGIGHSFNILQDKAFSDDYQKKCVLGDQCPFNNELKIQTYAYIPSATMSNSFDFRCV